MEKCATCKAYDCTEDECNCDCHHEETKEEQEIIGVPV